AASAAGSAAQHLATVIMISLGLALMLFFFFCFECDQVRLSRLFGDRSRKLENSFRLFDRGDGQSRVARIRVPYTAHEIVLAPRRPRLLSAEALNWWRYWQPIARQADRLFYGVLI